MKRIFIGVIVSFSTVMMLPVTGFAQSTTSTTPSTNRQQKVEQRCEVVEKRFTSRSGKIMDRIQKREALYDKEDKKIEDLLQKAKDKGVDTTKATTDLNTWKNKTAQLKADREALADKLKIAAQANCNSAVKAQFKTVLQDAKDQLKKIADIHKDKQDFFKNTLKPDLQAVRDQLKQKN